MHLHLWKELKETSGDLAILETAAIFYCYLLLLLGPCAIMIIPPSI